MIACGSLVSNNYLIYAYNYIVVAMGGVVCLWLVGLTYVDLWGARVPLTCQHLYSLVGCGSQRARLLCKTHANSSQHMQ